MANGKRSSDIELGDVVRDSVSKFEGVALAKLIGLHEANQFRVHKLSLNNDGTVAAGIWFEETRLQRMEDVERPKVGFKIISDSEQV